MIEEIAAWMLAEVLREGMVEQESLAADIESRFGKEYVPVNDNGNLSIRRDVLKTFRQISEESVVWDRTEKAWRKREAHDSPGRLQD
jgi:hypothetical protein